MNAIQVVFATCSAGFILESGHHTEEQSASVMRQVLCAVRYMHSQNVCHRDASASIRFTQSSFWGAWVHLHAFAMYVLHVMCVLHVVKLYYERQVCWAELPGLLNEVKYSNVPGEQRFMYHRFSLSLGLGWHRVRAHHIFLY